MKLINLPRKKTKAQYDEALASLLEVAQQEAAVRAVYLIGIVSQPGISDLDVLLCLNDDLREPIALEDHLPQHVRSLIGQGTILKVPRRAMKQVRIIDDFPLRRVWGEQFSWQTYDSSVYELCRVMDWLPERLVTLHRLRSADVGDALFALQLLRSLTVSLRKLSTLLHRRPYQSFIRAVDTLREEWWDVSSRRSDLKTLLAEAETVALQALSDCNDHVLDQKLIRPVPIPAGAELAIHGGPRFAFGEAAAIKRNRVVVPPAGAPRLPLGPLQETAAAHIGCARGAPRLCQEAHQGIVRQHCVP